MDCNDSSLGNPWPFVLQVVTLLSYIPITFIAYRLLREPLKRRRAQWELSSFSIEATKDYQETIAISSYNVGQYLLPLAYITLILVALYGMTHPFVICRGVWRGLLESTVDAFDVPPGGFGRELIVGRYGFWCWLGAYIHAIDRTVRHYLSHDLSPNVYIYAARRFIVSFVVGSIVGLGMGVLGEAARIDFDTNLTVVYIVAFGVGLFPDRGIRWIRTMLNRFLRQKDSILEQKPLTLIDGIGEWQQGRLDQEGITSVQNLANVSLLSLVVNTPFDVGQIVNWVDQAILISYASPEQAAALNKAGLRSACDVLSAVDGSMKNLCEATGLKESELQVLNLALESAASVPLVARFRRNAKRYRQMTESAAPQLTAASA